MRRSSGSKLGLQPQGRGSWGLGQGPLLGSALLYHRRTKCALLLNLKRVPEHHPSHIRAQESGGGREWAAT